MVNNEQHWSTVVLQSSLCMFDCAAAMHLHQHAGCNLAMLTCMDVQTQAQRQPSALHVHKRASHISVRASVASVAVVLVDDRHQRNIEVVQVGDVLERIKYLHVKTHKHSPDILMSRPPI
jgi:hypothetical protein